jgi:hypothetical protein
VRRLELQWDWEIPELLSFCGSVSVLLKPTRKIRLAPGVHFSRAAELFRLFFACRVLMVKEIQEVSRSAVAIPPAKSKWLGQSQTLVEEFCSP